MAASHGKRLQASKRIEAIDHLPIVRSRTGYCTDEEYREALAEYRELMAKQAKMVRRETELHTSVETVRTGASSALMSLRLFGAC